MAEVSTIGLDIAKQVFQAYGADASGQVVFGRKIVRTKLMEFFSPQPRCLVALDACGGPHYWGREIGKPGHLTECGYVVGKEATHVPMLIDQIEDPNCHLPESARAIFKVLIAALTSLDENIAVLDTEIGRRAKDDPVARRLITIPGVGAITATAIVALTPPAELFRIGRDLAAWLGLTSLQKSTAGKQRLGAPLQKGRANDTTSSHHRG